MVNGDPASLGPVGAQFANSRQSIGSPTNKDQNHVPNESRDIDALREESHKSRESMRQMCTIFSSIIAKQQHIAGEKKRNVLNGGPLTPQINT